MTEVAAAGTIMIGVLDLWSENKKFKDQPKKLIKVKSSDSPLFAAALGSALLGVVAPPPVPPPDFWLVGGAGFEWGLPEAGCLGLDTLS